MGVNSSEGEEVVKAPGGLEISPLLPVLLGIGAGALPLIPKFQGVIKDWCGGVCGGSS